MRSAFLVRAVLLGLLPDLLGFPFPAAPRVFRLLARVSLSPFPQVCGAGRPGFWCQLFFVVHKNYSVALFVLRALFMFFVLFTYARLYHKRRRLFNTKNKKTSVSARLHFALSSVLYWVLYRFRPPFLYGYLCRIWRTYWRRFLYRFLSAFLYAFYSA